MEISENYVVEEKKTFTEKHPKVAVAAWTGTTAVVTIGLCAGLYVLLGKVIGKTIGKELNK